MAANVTFLSLSYPLPPPGLRPNRSRMGDFRAHAQAAKLYRYSTKTLLKQQHGASGTVGPYAAALVQFIQKDNVRRDIDNLIAAHKPAQDAWKDAGLIVEDSGARLRPVMYEYRVIPGCEPCVRVDLMGTEKPLTLEEFAAILATGGW